ncbi:MAG TPA: hypothetical protein PLD47_13605 [Aggregatilineales bacterium]|nr:hypothetical protein [Anaerolineales bacterium]HRE48756.1 hypothetical protein [Aggregatilineales bacterium]
MPPANGLPPEFIRKAKKALNGIVKKENYKTLLINAFGTPHTIIDHAPTPDPEVGMPDLLTQLLAHLHTHKPTTPGSSDQYAILTYLEALITDQTVPSEKIPEIENLIRDYKTIVGVQDPHEDDEKMPNIILAKLQESKVTHDFDTQMYLRRSVIFPLYAYLLAEAQGFVERPKLKTMIGVEAGVFNQFLADYNRYFAPYPNDRDKFTLNDDGKRDVLEAFDCEEYDYLISKDIPGFEPPMSGIRFLQMINDIHSPKLDFASAIFAAFKRVLSDGTTLQVDYAPNQTYPILGKVRYGEDPLFTIMIAPTAVALDETMFQQLFYRLPFEVKNNAPLPALILGTSLHDPDLERKLHAEKKWVSHLWGLSTISLFRQLDGLVSANSTKRDAICKNLDALLETQGVLSISATQAVKNLKKKTGIRI